MNTNVRDGINFLSKITLSRLINALSVLISYYYSKLVGRPSQWGMPVSISFEPTTSCNLRCPECPSGLRSFTRPKGMLEQDLFKKTIDEISSSLWYLIFYFQGEPYLNPNFLDLVKYASAKRIYTATSTNAHYLSDESARRTVESGLDRLIISIDGTTQETYESYRVGGSLDKVIEGTKRVLSWKKKLGSSTPHVVFQFLVVRPNEHQVGEVKQLARELGVNEVAIKTAQIYEYENGSPLIPEQEQYSRYRANEDGTYSFKGPMDNHCWKMWHSCVVTWDGKIVPCCFDKDAHHQLGDVSGTSFREIWYSRPYQAFRQTLISSRQEVEMCKNCTEGTKVWA